MEEQQAAIAPTDCPVCQRDLVVTSLRCEACGAEVNGRFRMNNLASLREPHASVLDMFLRARGNVKHVERELGLSYPTVRARLEEAFNAAGYDRQPDVSFAGDRVSDEHAAESELEQRVHQLVEERLADAGLSQAGADSNQTLAQARSRIVDKLESGELSAKEATLELRKLQERTRR